MALQVYLHRMSKGESGTFGQLSDETGELTDVLTVERAPTGAYPCINAGTYTFRKYFSPHMQRWVWLRDDCGDGRQSIEMHPANDINDIRGCIGVGDKMGEIDGLPAVLDSQDTFTMLEGYLPDVFQLTIYDPES